MLPVSKIGEIVQVVESEWPGLETKRLGTRSDLDGIGRPSFVVWYRNPQRATPDSVRIAYQDEGGKWSSLQSDFLIVSRGDDGSLAASIVDPHRDYLADAKAKLRAFADFAEEYGDRLVRIESIVQAPDGPAVTGFARRKCQEGC